MADVVAVVLEPAVIGAVRIGTHQALNGFCTGLRPLQSSSPDGRGCTARQGIPARAVPAGGFVLARPCAASDRTALIMSVAPPDSSSALRFPRIVISPRIPDHER